MWESHDLPGLTLNGHTGRYSDFLSEFDMLKGPWFRYSAYMNTLCPTFPLITELQSVDFGICVFLGK